MYCTQSLGQCTVEETSEGGVRGWSFCKRPEARTWTESAGEYSPAWKTETQVNYTHSHVFFTMWTGEINSY